MIQNKRTAIIEARLNEIKTPLHKKSLKISRRRVAINENSIDIIATSIFNANTDELMLNPFTRRSYKKSLSRSISGKSVKKERTPK